MGGLSGHKKSGCFVSFVAVSADHLDDCRHRLGHYNDSDTAEDRLDCFQVAPVMNSP